MKQQEDTARRAVPPERVVAVVTGTRAEFGLLEPVMRAVREREGLKLETWVTGAHLLEDVGTAGEVEAAFEVHARVPMQRDGHGSRVDDAAALGRGIEGFAKVIAERGKGGPEWVVVLGDRIEAFAAAAAASVAGVAVGHIHGGDRAEGVADEAMRGAVSKLSHAHFAASEQSAERLRKMGEDAWRVHCVGSPAVDRLEDVEAMGDAAWEGLGSPGVVVLMHPVGRSDAQEAAAMRAVLEGVCLNAKDAKSTKMEEGEDGGGGGVLVLGCNRDAGWRGVMGEVEAWANEHGGRGRRMAGHMERRTFVGLLKRLAVEGGVLVGNSSAGLIEAGAVGVRVVNVGQRQRGRERGANVVDCEREEAGAVAAAVRAGLGMDRPERVRVYGDGGEGGAGVRIAEVLAGLDGRSGRVLRKINAY